MICCLILVLTSLVSAGNVIVEGNFVYEDRDNDDQSLKWATIQIWDEDTLSGDDLLDTTLTDTNGDFQSDSIDNDDPEWGTQDIYVRVIATSSAVEVDGSTSGESIYDAYTTTTDNVPDGTHDIGSWRTPTADDEGPAWWIYEDLLDGWDYVVNTADPGYIIPKQVATWQDDHSANYDSCSSGTHYHHNGDIHLDGRDGSGPGGGHANDEDVILHEYGHAVMYEVYENYMPPTPSCSPHWIADQSSEGCAWVEGWANFFPLTIFDDEDFTDTTQNFDIDIESRTPGAPWDEGDDVEGNVAASLWDLLDDSSEDDYNGNFNDNIWETFEDQTDDDFSEYWNDWQDDHSSSEEDDALSVFKQNTIYYYASEIDCTDGIDEDDDGFIDCADGDCTQGIVSESGFCCGSGCSTNGGTCQDASTSGFTCSDGDCDTYSEDCQNGELESSLVCSGTSLSCSGGDCEYNFGAPQWCDEITPGGSVCENSPGSYDELACELTGTNCYYEGEQICGAPSSCDEKDEDQCSANSGFQCEWQNGYKDDVVEECESSCDSTTQCDEKLPGEGYIGCGISPTYFADKCSSTCQGEDRGDNICRSSAFDASCTATSSCNSLSPGTDLNTCNQTGQTYYKDECNSNCQYQDITSVFECTDAGCSCSESLCDGLTTGDNIASCSGGYNYFADNCTSGAEGQDRGDNICRNSTFASGCSADSQCDGIVAGTEGCNESCSYVPSSPPTTPTSILCDGQSCSDQFSQQIKLNCSGSIDTENDEITYFIDAYYNYTGLINKDHFNNSLNTENLSFSGNENTTRYLEIYRYSNVTSAYLNLSGKESFNWDNEIISYWTLNETSGSNALDLASGKHNATNYYQTIPNIEANWTGGGKIGGAIDFNYSEAWLNITLSQDFSCLDECTINFWMKTPYWGGGELSANEQIINNWQDNKGWTLFVKDGINGFEFLVGNNSVPYPVDIKNRWVMMTGVYNGTDISLYVNGTLNISAQATNSEQNLIDLAIGRSNDAGGVELYRGIADEFSYWNRSLSDSEIFSLYNGGNGLAYNDKSLLQNPYLEIGTPDGTYEWSFLGEFNQTNNKTKDLSSVINTALNNGTCDCTGCVINGDNCTIPFQFHSDTEGELEINAIDVTYQLNGEIIWKDIGNHSETSVFDWDISDIASQSEVDLRCRAIDLNGSNNFSDYYSPGINLTIIPLLDTSKLYIKDSTRNNVSWFGNEGDIVLKGVCINGTSCLASSSNLFTIGNSSDSVVAYVNSTGDLCVEQGSCSASSSCAPSRDAFKIRNSTGSIVSYIDFDGELCFIGGLYENVDL